MPYRTVGSRSALTSSRPRDSGWPAAASPLVASWSCAGLMQQFCQGDVISPGLPGWSLITLQSRRYLASAALPALEPVRLTVASGHLLIIGCQSGELQLSQGAGRLLLDAGQWQPLNAGTPTRLQWRAGSRLLLVRVPVTELMTTALGLGLFGDADALRFDLGPGCPQAMASLGHLLEDALRFADQPLWRQALASQQQLCDVLLLQGWQHSLGAAFGARPLQAPALQRARRWILDHLHEDLDLRQIAAAAAVSTRTLHNLFRKETAMTPMEYVRALRIEQVWLALRGSGSESVTDLAVAFGFTNPGRFARQYRAQIGELPSATRRSRGL